jgi:hypothetical protein
VGGSASKKETPNDRESARSMEIGDRVLLYLKGVKRLYGVFQVTELPDEERIETKTWRGSYELPFRFELSNSQDKVATVDAPDLHEILPSLRISRKPWSEDVPKFRGMTVFQKQYLPEEDFRALLNEFDARGSTSAACSV